MIKFSFDNPDFLKEGEAFMYSTRVSPSPLIKVRREDAIPERWGSLTDEQFYEKYGDPEIDELLSEDNTEG